VQHNTATTTNTDANTDTNTDTNTNADANTNPDTTGTGELSQSSAGWLTIGWADVYGDGDLYGAC